MNYLQFCYEQSFLLSGEPLAQLQKPTVLKPGCSLYHKLLAFVVEYYYANGNGVTDENLWPTMRVERIEELPYDNFCHVHGDRILFFVFIFDEIFCISFPLEALVKFLLLTGAECNDLVLHRYVMNSYGFFLMDKIYFKRPNAYLRIKDFTIGDLCDSEAIRVRMAAILSHYMCNVTKKVRRIHHITVKTKEQ